MRSERPGKTAVRTRFALWDGRADDARRQLSGDIAKWWSPVAAIAQWKCERAVTSPSRLRIQLFIPHTSPWANARQPHRFLGEPLFAEAGSWKTTWVTSSQENTNNWTGSDSSRGLLDRAGDAYGAVQTSIFAIWQNFLRNLILQKLEAGQQLSRWHSSIFKVKTLRRRRPPPIFSIQWSRRKKAKSPRIQLTWHAWHSGEAETFKFWKYATSRAPLWHEKRRTIILVSYLPRSTLQITAEPAKTKKGTHEFNNTSFDFFGPLIKAMSSVPCSSSKTEKLSFLFRFRPK